jgi:hypothetical protein
VVAIGFTVIVRRGFPHGLPTCLEDLIPTVTEGAGRDLFPITQNYFTDFAARFSHPIVRAKSNETSEPGFTPNKVTFLGYKYHINSMLKTTWIWGGPTSWYNNGHCCT